MTLDTMQIRTCRATDAAQWDQYVSTQAQSTSYHRWKWKRFFETFFGWRTYYLVAERDGAIRGVLPLVWQKSLLGSYLSSLPHVKGGGIVADDLSCEQALLARAVEIAREVNAEYLELRHLTDHGLELARRDDKVSAFLELLPDPEEMLRRLNKKTRNLVRKSMTFGMSAEFGGAELVDDFYSVYRRNMRDLGSPSYSRQFFAELQRTFEQDTHVCVVRHQGKAVAAAWLLGYRSVVEVPWASSCRQYLALKPNMFLYWQLLCFAAQHGYGCFDFGRSSMGSGAFDFKLQWGAQAVPLYWEYWLPDARSMPSSSRSGTMQLVSHIWQRLPLPVTNLVGPKLMKFLPGI